MDGTRIKITAIHKEDCFHSDREHFIGTKGTLFEEDKSEFSGHVSGLFEEDKGNRRRIYFIGIKYEELK